MLLAIALAGSWSPEARAALAAPAHGRAWELVTPPDPNGLPVLGVLAADPSGERIVYVTLGPLPGAPAGGLASFSLAVRDPLSWTSRPIAYPYLVTTPAFAPVWPVAASKDMSSWIWTSTIPLLPGAPPEGEIGLYRGGTDGTLALLGDMGTSGATVSGVSDDGQRVVFETSAVLLPADAARTSGHGVYEFDGSELRLVSVDDEGASLSTCGTLVGAEGGPPNPVSRDATRIFLSSPAESCDASIERVYLRENGTTTTEISASKCTRPDCGAPETVRFAGATPSGAVAFMTTAQQLTDDDVDGGWDLYRYDVGTGALSRVSAGPPGVVADVIADLEAHATDDGSRVYFVARGALVPGQGTEGSPNVYMADGDGLRFVATLDHWSHGLEFRETFRMTPDGDVALFATAAALTADDTDVETDVYLYRAADGSLERVSGRPGEGNGPFDAEVTEDQGVALLIGHTSHALSADGERAFFRTPEPLLPEDVNDTVDVYEWTHGSLGLVTSGAGGEEVLYSGASADGSTVFFTTIEALVPGDRDGNDDLYAARVGGGFPEPAAPPGCAGSECVDAPTRRLSRAMPRSATHVEAEVGGGRLRLRPIGPAARRRIAATGRMRLVVRAPSAGRVSARAHARVGRRVRIVAAGGARVRPDRSAVLRLTLSRAALRRLERGRTLRVRLVLRHSGLKRSLVARLELRRGR